MKFKLSLRAKVILFFVIAAGIAGVVGSYIGHAYIKNEVYALKKQDYRLIAGGYAEDLAQVFTQAENIAEKISQGEEISDYLAKEESEPQQPEILRTLEAYLIADRYAAIYLLDNEGNTLASTDESFVGNNYGFRGYFQQARERGRGSEMAIGATSKEPGYYFARSVSTGQEGEVAGVVAVKMKPTVLKQVIDLHAGEEFDVLLADRYGIIIHSDNKQKQYKSLRYMSPEEKKEASAEKRFPGMEIQSLNYAKAHSVLQSRRTESFEVYSAQEKSNKILTISSLNNFDYHVLIDTDAEAIDAVVNEVAFWQVFIVVASVVIISAIFLYFLNKMLKPLSELAATAEKIVEGNMEERAQVRTEDEIGELAQSFNKMVNKLVKAKNRVDQKVKEKTRDLEKTNRYMTGRELKMMELKKRVNELEEELGESKKEKEE